MMVDTGCRARGRVRIAVVLVATLLLASCSGDDDGSGAAEPAESTASTSQGTTTAPDTTTAVESDGGLDLNDVQVLGSHNSYHQQPQEEIFSALTLLSSELAESIEYSHLPLTEQLDDYGIRQFEIDVFADPEGGLYANRAALPVVGLPAESGEPLLDEPGFKVLHTQDFDFATNCLTLQVCLGEIEAWSEANPDHLPIMVMIEMKDDSLAEAAAAEGVSLEGIEIEFTEPIETTAEVLDALDAEILAAVDESRIVTPDDVRGDHDTLQEAVLADGWPSLTESRGKLLFALVDTDSARDLYREPSDVLEGRVMFTSSEEGSPDAAFIRVDDPIDGGDRIRDLVEAGYLIRTRTDVPTADARNGDTTRREAALASGAQYLSTDYYAENPAFGTGYSVALPGGAVARCSPARMSLPEAECASELEELP